MLKDQYVISVTRGLLIKTKVHLSSAFWNHADLMDCKQHWISGCGD